MKSDIDFPKVEGVLVVIAKDVKNGANDKTWYAYLINRNDTDLEDVMVSTKGYGFINEEKRSTSVLRHYIGNLKSGDFALIEPIDEAVLPLNNEFWVSYYINGQLYDKKYIFVPESIVESNSTPIPELNLKGIIHS